MFALPVENSTAKAYLCNQGGTESLFLSILAFCILNMANKHGINLIPAYIATHLNVVTNFLRCAWLVPEWNLFPHVVQVALHLWSQPEVVC